jgi:hypothetical protein
MKYQVGASLPPDASSYIERQADTDFDAALRNREFIFVLNSRQMGKSSLRVRTMQKLKTEDFVCVNLSLPLIGTVGITADQWYATLIKYIADQCQISFNISDWWYQYSDLSPCGRFQKFIQIVLLEEITDNIIIFIDEIDSVLSLEFSADDFFIFMRACYE